ncbi:hypothetical protein G7054_g4838 [Neopestalotiopsis clavispora]|nr:hypothetical protein G7054_g4838 [Neopestalotiopsis clavispora]
MVRFFVSTLAVLLFIQLCAAFSLYPPVNSDKLANALNISSECFTALNQSLPDCDQTLFGMVGDFENFWWEDDNITTLCDGSCPQATSDWRLNVFDACYGEYIFAYGKLVPANSISDRFYDSLNIACLPSGSNNFSWCLTESQQWVGSDIVRPDCNANPSAPSCGGNVSAIPDGSQRMANLYSDDILCNQCFIEMLYSRVTSSLLSNEDHSDYLVDQLQDVADICSTQLRDFTIRAVPTYDPAPPVTSVPATTTSGATVSAAAATCAGQAVNAGSGCDALSTKYGVATGDLQAIANSSTCQITSGVCLPAACTLQRLTTSQTCDVLAASLKVTTVQFLSWNPNIIGLCDSLTTGQYICASAPGTNSSYALPPPPLGTAANAGNQQRGGAGGVVTPSTTVLGTLTNPASQGAKAGDTCFDFAKNNGISADKLYSWNPVLGSDGANCVTKFWASEYYCIGTQTSPSTAPGPTQSGIVSNCAKYAAAQAGDVCSAFASRNGISTAQLYSWNAVLGSSGQNCGTSLWASEYYCIGTSAAAVGTTTKAVTTSSSTTTTKPAGVTAPGPTQSGISAKCIKYAAAVKGDTCGAFATRNGITTANLYAWNAVLGASGSQCATSFWANEYYCIGIST